jgi:hypothetical protein
VRVIKSSLDLFSLTSTFFTSIAFRVTTRPSPHCLLRATTASAELFAEHSTITASLPRDLRTSHKMQASEVDNHIKRQTQALKGTSRDNIWKRFQEGFKGYTVDTFKLAHRVTLRDLHNLLVSYGVPVDTPRRGLSCADALQACLEKKLPKEPTLPPKP